MHTKQITDKSIAGINQRFSLIKLDELHANKYEMNNEEIIFPKTHEVDVNFQ